jgi:hypothetical protein
MWMKRITVLWVAMTLAFAPAFADQSSLYSPTTGTVSGLNLTNNYNSALNALSSCNSGASAPANTLSASPNAGMCWLNTSANPYKVEIYDGGQWEVVATLDSTNHWYEPIVGGGQGTLASATTTDLGSVPYNYISITGTTTITSLGSSAPVGSVKFLSFAASLTLTYNSTSLILPTSASITTAAGDQAIAVSIGSGNWRVFYMPISGQPLALAAGLVTPFSITGGLPTAMSGTNTTAAITISAVTAADQTGAAYIGWTGTKSWAVSNGNAANGYAGGTSLPSTSSTIHMYDCHGTSGDASFASLLAPTTAGGTFTAASCPTGYTSYARRIFSFTTSGAGAPNPYVANEVAGGAVWTALTTPTLDVNAGTMGSASRSLFTTAVPLGIKFQWLGRIGTSGSAVASYTSPDEPDVAPSTTAAPLSDLQVYSMSLGRVLLTNTSAQIGVRGTAGFTYYASTEGWIDSRRN